MSNFFSSRRLSLGSLLLIFGLVFFAACDSNDDDDIDLGDLDGEYSFSTLRFTPSNTNLPAADVLAQLNASLTRLDIQGSQGEFELEYALAGETSRRFIEGDASISGDQLRLEISDGDLLLLPDGDLELEVEGSGATLSATLSGTSRNVELWEDAIGIPEGQQNYDGLGEVGGTLEIELQRRN